MTAPSTTSEATRVDCVGLRSPEPILHTARAARELAQTGGLLEIRTDDAAFPLDLAGWCRSTSVELVSLEDVGQSICATIRVPPSSPPPSSAHGDAARDPSVTPLAATTGPTSQPSAIQPKTAFATLLDYRGRSCPEPIVELAKVARQARGPLEVLADDPAFPLDLKSWCRSASATSESLPSDPGVFRVLVFPKGITREAYRTTIGAAVALAAATAPAPAKPAASTFPPGVPTASFDLRALAEEAILEELEKISQMRPGTGVTLLVPAATQQRVLQWCTTAGYELRAYIAGGAIDLVLGARSEASASTALVPARGDYECALLVMHNDLESLLGALLVANSAAAQGMRTMIFFTFWGLNLLRADRPNQLAAREPVSFMQRVFKWLMPKGPRRQGLGQLNFAGMGASIMQGIMQRKNIQDLPALIGSAQEQGVRFVACTMSMAVMGIGRRELEPYPNLELGGVTAFVEAGRHAPLTLVF